MTNTSKLHPQLCSVCHKLTDDQYALSAPRHGEPIICPECHDDQTNPCKEIERLKAEIRRLKANCEEYKRIASRALTELADKPIAGLFDFKVIIATDQDSNLVCTAENVRTGQKQGVTITNPGIVCNKIIGTFWFLEI
jgi:hypothetical protein